MASRFLELATTPAVREARLRWDSVDRYPPGDGAAPPVRLGPAEAAFVAARDGFYLASRTEDGWPYVQFRGGPRGFLRVLDDRTLGFADLRGNRQLLTIGNTSVDDRVALLLMDYKNRRRLKILARLAVVDDPDLLRALADGVPGHPERAVTLAIEALDWNCPQHIPIRLDLAEVDAMRAPLVERIAALEAEVARLRGER
jgi:hypothetical protein